MPDEHFDRLKYGTAFVLVLAGVPLLWVGFRQLLSGNCGPGPDGNVPLRCLPGVIVNLLLVVIGIAVLLVVLVVTIYLAGIVFIWIRTRAKVRWRGSTVRKRLLCRVKGHNIEEHWDHNPTTGEAQKYEDCTRCGYTEEDDGGE